MPQGIKDISRLPFSVGKSQAQDAEGAGDCLIKKCCGFSKEGPKIF
jgi:hypothetical protein